MNSVNKIICALCFLFFAEFVSYAQEERDTTGFNALKHSMQHRWRPKNSLFVNEKFTDNMTFRFGGGVEQLMRNSSSTYSFGPLLRGTWGKGVNPCNILFVGVSGGSFRHNADGKTVLRGGLEFGHSFDLLSYFAGYDPDRIVWLRTVEALGVNLSRYSGKFSFSGSAYVGLNISSQIARNFEIFYQPEVAFYTSGIDGTVPFNWRTAKIGYGMEVGVTFHFNRYNASSDKKFIGEWLCENSYVIVSGGGNFQISETSISNPGILPSARETVQLGFGWTVQGPLSVEFALYSSRDVWKQFSDGRKMFCYYAGIRPQIVFDPLYWAHLKVFSLPVLFGPEIGAMRKLDLSYGVNRVYMGFTAALRPDFKICRNLALFLESRFSIMPYTVTPRDNGVVFPGTKNYYDMLAGLSFGMRVLL